MNFDAFYEVVKWLFVPALGGLFVLVWRLHDSLARNINEHAAKDEAISREIFAELNAIRAQASAARREDEERYVTSTELSQVEGRLREDMRALKADTKELLNILLDKKDHDPRSR